MLGTRLHGGEDDQNGKLYRKQYCASVVQKFYGYIAIYKSYFVDKYPARPRSYTYASQKGQEGGKHAQHQQEQQIASFLRHRDKGGMFL